MSPQRSCCGTDSAALAGVLVWGGLPSPLWGVFQLCGEASGCCWAGVNSCAWQQRGARGGHSCSVPEKFVQLHDTVPAAGLWRGQITAGTANVRGAQPHRTGSGRNVATMSYSSKKKPQGGGRQQCGRAAISTRLATAALLSRSPALRFVIFRVEDTSPAGSTGSCTQTAQLAG